MCGERLLSRVPPHVGGHADHTRTPCAAAPHAPRARRLRRPRTPSGRPVKSRLLAVAGDRCAIGGRSVRPCRRRAACGSRRAARSVRRRSRDWPGPPPCAARRVLLAHSGLLDAFDRLPGQCSSPVQAQTCLAPQNRRRALTEVDRGARWSLATPRGPEAGAACGLLSHNYRGASNVRQPRPLQHAGRRLGERSIWRRRWRTGSPRAGPQSRSQPAAPRRAACCQTQWRGPIHQIADDHQHNPLLQAAGDCARPPGGARAARGGGAAAGA